MKILFFDNDEERHIKFKAEVKDKHDIDYAYSVSEALDFISSNEYHLIYLDHDMIPGVFQKPGSDTGYVVAEAITKLPVDKRPLGVIIHSYNIKATQIMYDLLNEANIKAVKRIFDTGALDFWVELR
jgi:hypothetical protein